MRENIKSPFLVVQDFVSPQTCEDIVDMLELHAPDVDKDDKPILTIRTNETVEQVIYERFLQIQPQIEQYYNIEYRGMERINFEWYPQGSMGEHHSENASFLRGKWLRTKQRDLTAVLFLSDYQEAEAIELEFEVYGGKLEFPQHKFSFNPTRGTLVIFPSDPHFINITTPVFVGDLYQARLQIAAKNMYIYNPQEFPGNYTMWF